MNAETYPTVRIPRTVCPDMKAGQKLTLTIVDVGEDEYEVRYESKKKGEKERGREVAERYNSKISEGAEDYGGDSV